MSFTLFCVYIAVLLVALIGCVWWFILRPHTPSNVRANWGDSEVSLIWTATRNETEYLIFYRKASSVALDWKEVRLKDQTVAFLSITNGIGYEISVKAINVFGSSFGSPIISGRARASAPKNFAASFDTHSGNAIILTWSPVPSGKGYCLQRTTDSEQKRFLTIWSNSSCSETEAKDTNITFGTLYRYRVMSLDDGGESIHSDTIDVRPRAPAVKDLSAFLDPNDGSSIMILWKPVNRVNDYIVKRKEKSAYGITSNVTLVHGSHISWVQDRSFRFGITYSYTVTSIDVAGESEQSNSVSVKERVSAPTNLQIDYNPKTPEKIKLRWILVPKARGYIVQRKRSTFNEDFDTISIINDASIEEMNDTSFIHGVNYDYAIMTTDYAGPSKRSSIVSVCPRISAPGNLKVSCSTDTNNHILLEWEPVPKATSYIVKRARKELQENFVIIKEIYDVTIAKLEDDSFTYGVNYDYIVISCDQSGPSEVSNVVEILPRAPVPSDLKICCADIMACSVVMQWKSVVKNVSYVIERSSTETNGKFVVIKKLHPPSVGEITNAGLVYGITYQYIVTAEDKVGLGVHSNSVSICLRIPSPKGLKLSYDAQRNDGIVLNWKKTMKSKGYVVRRSTTCFHEDDSVIEIVTDNSITTIRDSSYTFGNTYYYVVCSIDSAGENCQYSNQVQIKPRAPQPTDLKIIYDEITGTVIVLKWKPLKNGNGYIVRRVTHPLRDQSPVTWTIDDASVGTINDTSFIYGHTYNYSVIVLDAAGESECSKPVSMCPRAPPPKSCEAVPLLETGGLLILTWDIVPNSQGYRIYRKLKDSSMESDHYAFRKADAVKNDERARSPIDNRFPNSTLSSAVADINELVMIDNPAVNRYVDRTVKNGIEYHYTIVAIDAQGNSPYFTSTVGQVILPSPSNFSIEIFNEQKIIALSWTAVNGAVGYRIERKAFRKQWKTIGKIHDFSVTKFFDAKETARNVEYLYQVFAFDANAESLPVGNSKPVILLASSHGATASVGIDIRYGDLCTEQADVIVVGSKSNGLVASVLGTAGSTVQKALHNRDQLQQETELVVIAGALPCKKIIFIPWTPNSIRELSLENSVRNFVSRATYLANEQKFISLAFPAIGCGGFKCDYREVAHGMLYEASRQLYSGKSTVKHISIIIEKTKHDIYEIFKDQLQSQLASWHPMIDYELPSHWETVDGQYQLRVTLCNSSEEYKRVKNALLETMNSKRFRSICVERIQNARWYLQYQMEKKYLHDKLGRETELRLFHGCDHDSESLQSIMENGFDRSLAGVSCGTRYGAGVYFSTQASESHTYTGHVAKKGQRTMFLCMVLVGETIQGDQTMEICPRGYHSTTDNSSIYCVYRDAQVYAQYLVSYE